jgi:hypothetical protein
MKKVAVSQYTAFQVSTDQRRKNFHRNFDERNSMQELTFECLETAHLEDDVKC